MQVESFYDPNEIIIADIAVGVSEGFELPEAENGVLADVTAVIQKALDILGEEGGGTVWLPKGYYRITDRCV